MWTPRHILCTGYFEQQELWALEEAFESELRIRVREFEAEWELQDIVDAIDEYKMLVEAEQKGWAVSINETSAEVMPRSNLKSKR